MGGAQVGGQRFFIHRKAVVLAGDADAAGIQILDRMVGAVVTKLHLEGLATTGQRHDLVSQTNAKGGNTGFDQLTHGGNRVVAGWGSPGPLLKKMPSGWCP